MEYVFEVGDIVIVKDGIDVDRHYDAGNGHCFYAPEMKCYQGTEFQIVGRHSNWGYPVYILDGIDNNSSSLRSWGWIESWLIPTSQIDISLDAAIMEELL